MNATANGPAGAAEQALAAHEATTRAAPVALVPIEEVKAHYRAVLASHAADRARELRRERGRWGIVGVLAATSVSLGVLLASLMPLKRILPVVVHQFSDGSWTTTVAQDDVPVPLREATMAATLWLYVTARERFNTATHHEDQQVVFTLSDRATGDAYQERVDPKNKDSPWKRYGTRTTVRLQRVSEGLGCGTQPCAPGQTPNSYAVRYRRVEKTEGQREVATQRQSTVRFRIVADIPAWQRVTYNPLGLQAVEYSWTDEGAMQ